MAFIQEREINGTTFLYLEKSMRIGSKVTKVSKYLGKKKDFQKDDIEKEMKKFALEIDDDVLALVTKEAGKCSFNYPITLEEIGKIERMNINFKEIRSSLNKNDWLDLKKRFVANFVFESNALEGNSLTLKNFSEIVFEDKIAGSTDLREVFDAKNSYAVFSELFASKKKISEKLIIDLHGKIMKNIDDRTGYKNVPNFILGRNLGLTEPKNVPSEAKRLIKWYDDNKNTMYPLELAFKFHHKFEKIHPFADGNGRIGRLLLNYILIKKGCFPVIIRKSHRTKYLKALHAADNDQYVPLMRFALQKTKETYRNFFEVYYQHL